MQILNEKAAAKFLSERGYIVSSAMLRVWRSTTTTGPAFAKDRRRVWYKQDTLEAWLASKFEREFTNAAQARHASQ